ERGEVGQRRGGGGAFSRARSGRRHRPRDREQGGRGAAHACAPPQPLNGGATRVARACTNTPDRASEAQLVAALIDSLCGPKDRLLGLSLMVNFPPLA